MSIPWSMFSPSLSLNRHQINLELFLQSQQDENINKVILKNEDVATLAARGSRDRCRLILYPDVIVCCNLRAKLLARYFPQH